MNDNEKNGLNLIGFLLKMKKYKILLIVACVIPLLLLIMFFVISMTCEAFMPTFQNTMMAGGTTIYGTGSSNAFTDLTELGIDTWSEEERLYFDELAYENNIFNNNFQNYNANRIKKNDEKLEVDTIVSTVNYMGAVNLFSYSKDYDLIDGEYNMESNVSDQDTRAFYIQAEKTLGNTFMAYPSMRMLLGNFIANNVNFTVVTYVENPDGSNNAEKINSDWSYIGKITSSNVEDAKKSYSPRDAIYRLSEALSGGKILCSDPNIDEWTKLNACYETGLLFDEILKTRLDDVSTSSIINFLTDKYDALFPDGKYEDGFKYIAVEVKKNQDYELYEKYLKNVYIPYFYIDCDTCTYRNMSLDDKGKVIDQIYHEIMLYINAFKEYNNTGNNSTPKNNPGSFGVPVPNSGYGYLPTSFYDQLIVPLQSNTELKLSACVGYYDAMPNTTYYCTIHGAADIVGYGGVIVSPADGVVTNCSTNKGNWGPYLEITHTLMDDNNDQVEVISYYRHWVDKNGNISCSTFENNKSIKQGDIIGYESNQAGSHSVARHLHFGLKSSSGVIYYIEDFLIKNGVNTSSADGTTNCDNVRSVCNEYCSTHTCKSA